MSLIARCGKCGSRITHAVCDTGHIFQWHPSDKFDELTRAEQRIAQFELQREFGDVVSRQTIEGQRRAIEHKDARIAQLEGENAAL